ncbi:glutamate racemase [Candidatus Bipolaricaulota bacterium]|nr:glutamate racemase [Candidatus Bipolaricaulota bacterium]
MLGRPEKPIGVFDSGLGGLAVTSEIAQKMPDEDILYFADFANLPFGPKQREQVEGFVSRIVDFLTSREVKTIVIACNTATVAGLDKAKEIAGEIPVVGMINPAVNTVLNRGCYSRVGVIGTAGTINSSSYEETFVKNNWKKTVHGHACPNLLRLAEKGEIDDKERINRLARECVNPLLEKGIDALILGCTDFTCVKDTLKEVVPSRVDIIDPAREVARTVNERLKSRDWMGKEGDESQLFFYHTNGLPEETREFAKKVFNLTIDEIVPTDI